MDTLPPKALALILQFEGMDQPSKWPGTQSGITLGHGFDLGYTPRNAFYDAWSPHLTINQMQRLSEVIGWTAQRAASAAPRFRDIVITKAAADEVFTRCSVPNILRMTLQAFPKIGVLAEAAPDAAGALASCVFNRGPSVNGARRVEMKRIRDLTGQFSAGVLKLAPALRAIAGELRKMKRLWPTVKGLRRRRDAEAALVESCIPV